MNGKYFLITINSETHKKLKALSERSRVPMSVFANQAISDFLATYNPNIPLADWIKNQKSKVKL